MEDIVFSNKKTNDLNKKSLENAIKEIGKLASDRGELLGIEPRYYYFFGADVPFGVTPSKFIFEVSK